MRTETPAKTWMLLACVLLVAPVLSGCFGSDDAPKAEDGLGENVVIEGKKGGEKKEIPKNTDHSGDKTDPSAHFHHYWGEPPIDFVVIYNGPVPFRNWDTAHLNSYNTLAWAEFGLEDDGNDVADPATDKPIGPREVADTVFAGTNRIVVEFPGTFPPGVNQMLFQYKPSNSPLFFPEGGITVAAGSVVDIKLNEVGMTDPPHQFTTSRWKFRLIAYNELCGTYNLEGETCPPAFINEAPQDPQQGSTYEWPGLKMTAYNGGTKSLDPPHPDFWNGVDVIDLGTYEGRVEGDAPAVQTPLVRERINAMTDISLPPNKIVPLGTEYVEVKVTSTNTAPGAENVKLKLYYHGADGIEYQAAEEEGEGVYKIYDKDGAMVDPPYEANSFWRFKLVPTMDVGGNPQENMGAFQGDFTLEFKAHMKPGFVLT